MWLGWGADGRVDDTDHTPHARPCGAPSVAHNACSNFMPTSVQFSCFSAFSPAHIKPRAPVQRYHFYQSSSQAFDSLPQSILAVTLVSNVNRVISTTSIIMIAATVPSARFATSARVAPVTARGVVARAMKAPEPETDAVPSSTSEGGVKDSSSAITLDVPSQAVDTPVLGPVQGVCPH